MNTETSPEFTGHEEVKGGTQTVNLIIGWVLISIPLLYGIISTLQRAVQLFQ